ncbi:nicotinamide-nucleotide amidohydrolase family protein [Arthrobacter sp. JZ12]|uniref:CinA family protein n=1 Tax=Arthrobacter sp. JZ12 TaxID=2654190 RepID=UPI002B4620BC|nr:CinA family protein [Arthrobacter sp. JZ12]WRH24627.1 nicotinamide-nucleotide amidohydrolase family protein [Arthrobacter sp. JZ12]
MTPYSKGPAAEEAIDKARRLGLSVATAESLTAGMVAAALATVPGASAVLRGGVVSYHRDLKASLLGVEAGLLARVGAVDPSVAEQMAAGARRSCGADVGVATTGVAGPEPHEGKEVGVVVVAVVTENRRISQEHRFGGDRAGIRKKACEAALKLLVEVLEETLREQRGAQNSYQ